jgi:dTMP kinase
MKRRSRPRGRLVALEGIDGSGKSTLAHALARALRARGFSIALRREPADAELGALAQRTSRVDAWTGGVYFTLDRNLARSSLANDLATHDIVLTDRSYYSTLAYQGSALSPRARRRLADLQLRASIPPDRVVLLDLDVDDALRRLAGRSAHRDPLERRATLRRVAREYQRLARPPRWIVLDARKPTGENVAALVRRLSFRTTARRRR